MKVDYFNGKIQTRAIEKDPETGEEVFAQEIHAYAKDEIKRIGKNAKKHHEADASADDEISKMMESADAEERRELQELMSEF